MLMDQVFPRNPDGTLKSKEPCQTPGCDWPNWHICLDKTDPGYKTVHIAKPVRYMPYEQRMAIAESQRQRHAERRELTAERDNLIIKQYTEGDLGMNKIAEQMGLAQSTVNKVLNRAQREGVLKIRPKGATLSRPATG